MLNRGQLAEEIMAGKAEDGVLNYVCSRYESMTCEKCNYYTKDEGKYGIYEGECSNFVIQNKDFSTVKYNFGCNEWEGKQ